MICSKCNSVMVIRRNKKTGQPFWGCPKYPKCKNAVPLYVPPDDETFLEYCQKQWEDYDYKDSTYEKLDMPCYSHWRKRTDEQNQEAIIAYGTHQKAKDLRKDMYRSYLESDEWKDKHDAILERDDYICRICNESNEQLQVHHLTYERIYNESLYDLITVCHQCHKMIHSLD